MMIDVGINWEGELEHELCGEEDETFQPCPIYFMRPLQIFFCQNENNQNGS